MTMAAQSSQLWPPPTFFSSISDDLLINIFTRLDADPRDLARLSCVCRRFATSIHATCWKIVCLRFLPSLVSDLTQPSKHAGRLHEPPGGWASLQKLHVCCPGLLHAGVLFDSWDFGLDRELGCSAHYEVAEKRRGSTSHVEMLGSSRVEIWKGGVGGCLEEIYETAGKRKCIENEAEFPAGVVMAAGIPDSNDSVKANRGDAGDLEFAWVRQKEIIGNSLPHVEYGKHLCKQIAQSYSDMSSSKRQRAHCHDQPHLAVGSRKLSREQGNKLLANRFRADTLYICDWPGCVHPGERRKYKLFRGVFKNFKNTHVWRNLRDMKIKATDVPCAFCSCKSTWDMVTSFCLKRSIEYHDDGEPVVRAYVCDNGHVSGAWTDRPLYNL